MAIAELSDVRCYYEILGSGPPLLLIPGLGVTCRTWDPVVPELSRHFTLILPDNRGIGLSQARREARCLTDYAADLLELLDHLQIDRTHVMGLSLGGIIAQRFAIDHSSRVDRLVLSSCADRFSPYLRQVALMLRHALRRFPWEMFLRSVELLGSAPEYVDANEKLVEDRLRAKLTMDVDRGTVAHQLKCLACSEVMPEDYRFFGPTLVIAGEADRLIPACYSRKMSELIKGSRFVLIPRCGHNPFQERPDEVLPHIVNFLSEPGAGAQPPHNAAGHAACFLQPSEYV